MAEFRALNLNGGITGIYRIFRMKNPRLGVQVFILSIPIRRFWFFRLV
jgi:hypothetical protein